MLNLAGCDAVILDLFKSEYNLLFREKQAEWREEGAERSLRQPALEGPDAFGGGGIA